MIRDLEVNQEACQESKVVLEKSGTSGYPWVSPICLLESRLPQMLQALFCFEVVSVKELQDTGAQQRPGIAIPGVTRSSAVDMNLGPAVKLPWLQITSWWATHGDWCELRLPVPIIPPWWTFQTIEVSSCVHLPIFGCLVLTHLIPIFLASCCIAIFIVSVHGQLWTIINQYGPWLANIHGYHSRPLSTMMNQK